MKVKSKNPITQLENSQESLTSIMTQREDRISEPEDKVEELGHTMKESKNNLKDTGKEETENGDTRKRSTLQIRVIDKGEDNAQTRPLTQSN